MYNNKCTYICTLIKNINYMRKIEEQNVRKLYKHASSYAITLPIAIVRALKWQERQKLVVELKGDRVIINDWKKN